MNWDNLSFELNELIDAMLNRGSIGISDFCEGILPLRRRLEEGERSEELYNEIQKAIEKYAHDTART